MDQHADAANVPLPTAELLMQGGVADNFPVYEGQQRQVAAQVDILAPISNDFRINDAVLDEHALRLWHAHKELVEVLLVVLAQRAQLALRPVLQGDFLRILLDF